MLVRTPRNQMKLHFKITFLSFALLSFVVAFAGLLTPSTAQELFLGKKIGDFGSIPQVGDPVSLSAEFKIKTGQRAGVLNVTAEIDSDWHIFSMNKTKGPMPTKISVAESDDYKLAGKFKSDHPPHIKVQAGFDEPCEEYEGTVTWSAPIELSADVDPKDLVIDMVYNGQTCESKPGGSCRPLTIDVQGSFGGFDDKLVVATGGLGSKVEIEEYRFGAVHSTVKARLVRAAGVGKPISPGDTVKLEITATPDDGWHVYSYSLKKTQYMSTVVGFTETNGWAIESPKLSEQPEEGEAFGVPAFYHHHPITWTFNVKVPKSAINESYPLKGIVGFQVCSDSNCDQPIGIAFEATIPMGKSAIVPVKWEDANYAAANSATKAPIEASKQASDASSADDAARSSDPDAMSHIQIADTPEQLEEMLGYYDAESRINYVKLGDSGSPTTFWTAIFGAFVGGMLLNLMPCVFPVLGLKVMGFVQQAGSEASKIRNHGLAFTAGLVVSMWCLAGFILFLKLSLGQSVNWGQQMGNPYFVVAMIVLLFILGLNMAGVFEIGTSLTSVGGQVQQKKGYTGSFLSGILTTLIATPCSGPFLGAAMGYTLAQPAITALFLFTIFALGIAMPYLILSFYPALIRLLPRPGKWMESFKVIMAFALFATVAFFARTFGAQTGVKGLSWLVMALVVIGLAAYIYGQWSPSEVKGKRRFLIGYGLALLFAAVGGYMCYDAAGYKGEALARGDWESWQPGKVEYTLANAEKKPIIWVDYTADW